jgi:tRNA pseudouridine38-40 synthase
MAFRMKLVVAYLGTPFHGWQRQRGQRTVQGELEKALSVCVGGAKVTVMGAGRTDAGVHAAGQTAHCNLPGRVPPDSLVRAVNAVLPAEIRLLSARPASPGFHAMKSALGKLYIYRLRWCERELPWIDLRSAAVAPLADMEAFTHALSLLPGTRDWASFTVPNPGPQSTVRTLFRARTNIRRNGIDLEFVGNGFLRYQVRRMVGAVLEVGRKKRTIEDLARLLDRPTPGASILTAPAVGLSLERVFYRRTPVLTRSP